MNKRNLINSSFFNQNNKTKSRKERNYLTNNGHYQTQQSFGDDQNHVITGLNQNSNYNNDNDNKRDNKNFSKKT